MVEVNKPEKEVTLEDIAKECVGCITLNINMRSGFGSAYRMIDPAIKEEIRAEWIRDLTGILEKSGLKIVKEVVKPITQIGVK